MAPRDKEEYIKIAHQRAAEKKTHVSFPQLKYPSLRDEGLRDPVQWLEGKAMDDGAEGLWRVYNGLYDLNDFIDRHPGGAEWLELSKGTDITEAFETHHYNPSVEKMLEKFYVREAKTPRNSPFTFHEDGFYRTLKRAVQEELKKVPTDAPRYADMITDGLLMTCLISSALSCWSSDYWVKLVSHLIASASLAMVTVAAHNYIHRKTNWRMYLFNLSLWSYRDFRVTHVLSHHLFPNTLMDLEVSGFEPFVLWNPRKKSFLRYFTFFFEQAISPFIFPLNFIRRFVLIFLRKGYLTQHYRWHDGVGFLLPVWMWLVSGQSFYYAFTTWLWIVCTASYMFYLIGFNAAHHHPDIFKDGDEVREVTPDWGMHELEAVMDRKEVNGSLFRTLTLFGDHALHHLFPTLDHAVLHYLYPVFLEHCEKFKGNFRLSSTVELFIGQLKQTVKVDPKTLDD